MVHGYTEFPHEAYDEQVGVVMILQVIHLRLLVVAKIPHAEGGLPEGEVEGQHVAHRGCRERCCDYHIAVVVAAIEYLVVRLSVVWREHDAEYRYGQLIAQVEGFLPQPEVPRSCCRRAGVDACTQLSGVIGITGIVEEAEVQVAHTSHPKVYIIKVEIIVTSPAEHIHASKL